MKILSLVLLLVAGPAKADPAPLVFTDTNSVEAERNMKKIAGKKPADLHTDAERTEWAHARLAWISLLRLPGSEKEARKIFVGCEKLCREFGEKEEWKAVREWGCASEKKATACK